MFNEDPNKMNMMRNSTSILEKLESLQTQNMELEMKIEQQNSTIRQMRERTESLLEEKSNLEGLLNQIDEAENHLEFEEYKAKVEQKYKDQLLNETGELSMRVSELEHMLLKKDLEIETKTKKVETLETKIEEKQAEIENYEENYTTKIKLEESLKEFSDLKQQFSSLENTITFKNLKISELEVKVKGIEEKAKKDQETAKKKAEKQYEDAKKKWGLAKEKLKKEIAELSEWKKQNMLGAKVDPEEM
jgi:chromosome segregation ATPase